MLAAPINHGTKDEAGGWCELVAAGVLHQLDTVDDLTFAVDILTT